MPWKYCEKCGSGIFNWREEFDGCTACGHSSVHIEDGDVVEAIKHLLEKIDELKKEVEDLRDEVRAHIYS